MKITIINMISVSFLILTLCIGCFFTGCADATENSIGENQEAENGSFFDETLKDTVESNINRVEAVEEKGQQIHLGISYFFNVTGDTSKIEFISVIPDDYELRQKVIESSFSIRPVELFESGNTRYAKFVILNPDEGLRLDINMKIQIFDYDFKRAQKLKTKISYRPLSSEEYAFYTASEKNIETKDPGIVKIADSFKESDQVSLVQSIYDFVLERLDYQGYNPEDCGAAAALSRGGGDCTEYSDLFVTLCRAKGIPARVVEGYTTDAIPDEIGMGHNWSEVYLEDVGWVPFDCIFDDNNGIMQDTTFDNLKSVYLYTSFTRNDPKLFGYHYYAYYYYGDEIGVEKSISIH